ncbi:hypothetical protein EXN66_Car009070 [Channa argus]|uniref:Secreted protein n=1 Tax=Channa argus TaxID=215402 RepID=A0A6G1PTC3_CHAAH|nr:hypothetical protein EXN66_Car009070 [Channa argus]
MQAHSLFPLSLSVLLPSCFRFLTPPISPPPLAQTTTCPPPNSSSGFSVSPASPSLSAWSERPVNLKDLITQSLRDCLLL